MSLFTEKYVVLIPCVVGSRVGGLIPCVWGFLFERDPVSKHQAVQITLSVSCLCTEVAVVEVPRFAACTLNCYTLPSRTKRNDWDCKERVGNQLAFVWCFYKHFVCQLQKHSRNDVPAALMEDWQNVMIRLLLRYIKLSHLWDINNYLCIFFTALCQWFVCQLLLISHFHGSTLSTYLIMELISKFVSSYFITLNIFNYAFKGCGWSNLHFWHSWW